MDSRSHCVLSEKGRSRPRGLTALYLIGFLLAVTAARHHHLNPVADLLSDGPSNSGIVVEVRGPVDAQRRAQMNPARLTEDESCPACFHHDFALAAAQWVEHTQTLKPLEEIARSPSLAPPSSISESPASRSPPRLA